MDRHTVVKFIWEAETRVEIVLRGHLAIEHYLDELLVAELKEPDALPLRAYSWKRKLDLARALGLVPSAAQRALEHANLMRNRLAHNLGEDITEEDIRVLLESSSGAIRAGVEKTLEEVVALDKSTGDETIDLLRGWFFGVVMEMEHWVETREYDRSHHQDMMGAAIRVVMAERRGKPITWEEGERQQGMPPRPRLAGRYLPKDWPESTDPQPEESRPEGEPH